MTRRVTRSYEIAGQQVAERVTSALSQLAAGGSTRSVRDAAQAALDDAQPTLAHVAALVGQATSGATEADQIDAIERLGQVLAAGNLEDS